MPTNPDPYVFDEADDDSRRCIDCRNSFWPNGDISVCAVCEEWVCKACEIDHKVAHDAD